ncbi:S-adenosylmethionine decarboxylase proenzyme-like [Babylonia areolata]|uniref:S-adenosylmethionine decarboxylase proenzyme-like n=1 Tax=Babylonia areolata TaxID=304850 RepID=UPI003FD03A0C
MASVNSHHFEGIEKLLEVWFKSSSGLDLDLRTVGRCEWDKLLKIVKCEIISVTSNQDMDAYVLSESSMFVTKDRFILKTCGTTTLLLCVEPLLNIVKEKVGYDQIEDIFYSRKNFSRPELQHNVHQNFESEVQVLDTIFPNGSAYTLGRINKDCWYLYTLEDEGVTRPDQTFELLMWDMCQEKMKFFSQEVCKDGKDASQKSGIVDIIPGMEIDDVLFKPCGYSMNGLLPDGCYITIHVTPEPHCSFVSFESNVPQETYHDMIEKVLDVFSPGHFLMTIFANKASIARDTHKTLEHQEQIKGYTRNDHQLCLFKNYTLTYTQYSKTGTKRKPSTTAATASFAPPVI